MWSLSLCLPNYIFACMWFRQKKTYNKIEKEKRNTSVIFNSIHIWSQWKFHVELKKPKQKRMKAKIKSKPIQQKNSIKSNIAYPNLENNNNCWIYNWERRCNWERRHEDKERRTTQLQWWSKRQSAQEKEERKDERKTTSLSLSDWHVGQQTRERIKKCTAVLLELVSLLRVS